MEGTAWTVVGLSSYIQQNPAKSNSNAFTERQKVKSKQFLYTLDTLSIADNFPYSCRQGLMLDISTIYVGERGKQMALNTAIPG